MRRDAPRDTEPNAHDEAAFALLRDADDASWWRSLAPDLHIGGTLPPAAVAHGASGEVPLREAAGFVEVGFVTLHAAAPPEVTNALTRAIAELSVRGLPPLFLYVFDEPWALGAALRDRIARATGHTYELLADAWAFAVAPGEPHAGWAPHRGSTRLSRAKEAPDLVDVWVALTDATLDNGCMALVPRDDDPDYPGHLDIEAPTREAWRSRARLMPIEAGDALAWDANVMHWGERSTARATRARMSASFVLRRADAPRAPGDTITIDAHRFDLRARLDLLAQMIAVYGHLDTDLTPPVRRWAQVLQALAASARRST